jgi:hypothetical protein
MVGACLQLPTKLSRGWVRLQKREGSVSNHLIIPPLALALPLPATNQFIDNNTNRIRLKPIKNYNMKHKSIKLNY